MVLVLRRRMGLRPRLRLRVLELGGMGMDSRRIIPIIKRRLNSVVWKCRMQPPKLPEITRKTENIYNAA
jgi:hypothetical protein